MNLLSTFYTKITGMVLQNSFSVATNDALPRSVRFGMEGMRMYLVGATNKKIYQFELTTAYDPTTATYSKALDTSTIDADIYNIYFKPDGLKAFVVGASGKKMIRLTLSTAWDITTATVENSYTITATVPTTFTFKPDGSAYYVLGVNGSNMIMYQYDLSTAWDITTSVINAKTRILGDLASILPQGLDFALNGTYFYNTQTLTKLVIEHKLANEWDFTSDLATNNVSISGMNYPMNMLFNSNLNKVCIMDQNDKKIYQYRV